MANDKRMTFCNHGDVFVRKGDRIVIDTVSSTMSHNKNGEYVVVDTRLVLRHNQGTSYGSGLVREIDIVGV